MEAQEVEPVAPLRALLRQVPRAVRHGAPRRARGAVLLERRAEAAVRVEQRALLLGLEQPLVVALAVDLEQLGRERAQRAARDRALVDVGARAAVERQRAAEDELRLPLLHAGPEVLRDHRQLGLQPAEDAPRRGLAEHEAPLDPRLLRALAHPAGRAAARRVAEQELERAHEQAFSCPRLTRDHVQAGAEGELRRVDQRQIPDGELDQHGFRQRIPRHGPGFHGRAGRASSATV